MSKFTLTVVDDYDYRILLRDYEDTAGCAEIVYEENRGVDGWFEWGRVGPFDVNQIDTLIKRLKTAKDILEEDDET